VKDRINKESYALKVLEKEHMQDSHLVRLKKEISTLRTLDHFNIAKYYSTYEDDDQFYILMEYAAGGSLT
jgi:serine/threonine protein kinase